MSDIETNSMSNQTDSNDNDITDVFGEPSKGGAEAASEIDELFGFAGDTEKSDTKLPSGDPSISSMEPNTKKMTPDEYMRELQSRADKATSQLKMLEAQNKELSGAAEFVNQLYEDPEVFNALVAEINPELVKPSTPEDFIRKNLQKEFGEDFVPDENEENVRGSRTWLYNKRADDLYGEALKHSSAVPETVKSLRQKRAAAAKEMQAKAQQEKQAILSNLKWNDDQYNGFLNWANKVSTLDFAKIYQYAQNKKSGGMKAPNLANVPGGSPKNTSAYMQELNEFFGK